MSYVIVAESAEEAEAKLRRSFPQSKHIKIRELKAHTNLSTTTEPRQSMRRNFADAPQYPLNSNPYQEDDNGAVRDIIVGGLFFVIGIGVTAFTYFLAEGGGAYVVAWGAILFGFIQMVRGIANLGAR